MLAGVEDRHARREDNAVHRKRHEAGRQAGLPVRAQDQTKGGRYEITAATAATAAARRLWPWPWLGKSHVSANVEQHRRLGRVAEQGRDARAHRVGQGEGKPLCALLLDTEDIGFTRTASLPGPGAGRRG